MSGRGPCRTPADQLVAPEYRRWRREHGLQLPLHGQQLAAWLLLLLSAAVMGGVLVPALCPPLRLPAAVLAVVVLLVHGVTHIVATLLDPAHGDLRARRERVPVPEFDRNVHAHVIENGRCHLCNIGITSTRTKHCSVCNKCVDQFDHHCKWLNHCIGRRNYGWFLACVTSAAAVALLVLALSAGEIVLLYLSPERLGDCVMCVNGTQALGPIEEGTMEMSPDGDGVDPGAFCSPRMKMFGLPAPRSVFFSTAGVFALLSLLCGILLIHLLLFHVYIMARDMTTYEYIRGLAAPRTKSPSKQTSPRCRFLSEALHKNRVRPGPPVQPPSRASGSTSPAGRVSSRGSAPPSRASRLTGVSVETLAREVEGMEERERETEEEGEREGEREGGHSPEGCSWPRRGGEKSESEKTSGENGPVGTVGESGAGGDASTPPRTGAERRRDRDTQSASEHRSLLAKLVKSVRALSAFPVFTVPAGITETPQTCATSNGHAVGVSGSTTDHLASPQSPPPSTPRKEPLGSVEASHDLESPPPGVTQVMSRWRRTSLPWLLLDGSGDPIEPESASAGDEAPYHWTGQVHTTGQTHT